MLENRHGAVILAAGGSSRLGQPKQLLMHHGETLIRRAVRAAMSTQPVATIVVVGARGDDVFASVADLAPSRVDCSDWQLGMGASLRAGLAALPSSCAGALIVLCDQPALGAEHLKAVCAAWHAAPDHAAASFYAGKIGVPALIPRAWFDDAVREIRDRGARDLLERRRDRVSVVENEALAADIDKPADLSSLSANMKET